MSKLKQTYQQALFSDDELSLVDHDAIVRWADKLIREQPESLLRLLGMSFDEGTVKSSRIKWEPIITDPREPTGKKTIIGANDIEAIIEWKHKSSLRGQWFIFEAKAKIKTAGELIRQLQFYSQFSSDIFDGQAMFVVVAPASEFKGEIRQILHEQGFYTLNYGANV